MTEIVTVEDFTAEEIALAQAGVAAPWNGLLLPYNDIYFALKQQIPPAFLEERSQGGAKLTYWPWWVGVLYFNKIAPGWGWIPNPPVIDSGHIGMTGVVYVPTLETGFPGVPR